MDKDQDDLMTSPDEQAGFDDEDDLQTTERPDADDQQTDEQADNVAEEAIEYAQLTTAEKAELQARAALIDEIKATQDKSFGTFGRTIKGLQDSVAGLTAGPAVDIDQADIDAMRSDGFESHARALEKIRDLKVVRTGGVLTDDDKQELRASLKREMQVEQVADEHPDWTTVAASTEFQAWKATQSAADQERLTNSWSPGFIVKALSAFKDSRKAKASTAPHTRNSRMAAAVTPRGSGSLRAPLGNDETAGFDSA